MKDEVWLVRSALSGCVMSVFRSSELGAEFAQKLMNYGTDRMEVICYKIRDESQWDPKNPNAHLEGLG